MVAKTFSFSTNHLQRICQKRAHMKTSCVYLQDGHETTPLDRERVHTSRWLYINYILKYIQIENSCFKFVQDFAALLTIRDFLQKLLPQSHLVSLFFFFIRKLHFTLRPLANCWTKLSIFQLLLLSVTVCSSHRSPSHYYLMATGCIKWGGNAKNP